MQFKHPEFLYALFLLLIPIIVHLFHLRRFKKEVFTNVKFLKKVESQTRKSSQLKKWLTLLARLFALAAIVFAFAQPFIPNTSQALKEKETVVYIDNSFSMQQKGAQGELLKQAVQEVLQTLPDDMVLSVITNDEEFRNQPLSELKDKLLKIDYSPVEADFKTISLRAKKIFSQRQETQKQFIAISDFQAKNFKENPQIEEEIQTDFIQLKGENQVNFSVDSVYFSSQNAKDLEIQLSSSHPVTETLPVSLYKSNKELLAKSSAGFEEDSTAIAEFSIPEEETNLEGFIEIEDNSLRFDNTLFFSLQKPKKIKILALSENKEVENFLHRIYNKTKFDFISLLQDEVDYNKFENADLIVLNELKNIPNGLINILEKHQENGGFITIIPAEKSTLETYNNLLLNLEIGSLKEFQSRDLKITNINFSHPLYADVFDSEVDNFQYPKTKGSFNHNINSGNSVLSFNNGNDFLISYKNTYIFTTSLALENSNFKQSPLIAPTFYNMAKQSLKQPQLAYTLGEKHIINLPISLEKDEVLHLENEKDKFIPQQRRFNDKVEITLTDLPEKAGTYQVLKQEEKKAQLSFNYNRSENQMIFQDLAEFSNSSLSYDIKDYFKTEINKNEVDHLWKWFVIFALIFLIIEVLLLKLLK